MHRKGKKTSCASEISKILKIYVFTYFIKSQALHKARAQQSKPVEKEFELHKELNKL